MPVEGRGGKERDVTDNASSDTERKHTMSLNWKNTIVSMARTDPKLRFTNLAHRLTPGMLEDAFHNLNPRAAPGPDGITMAAYKDGLEDRIEDLWFRLSLQQYRASPARRKLIPKPNGKMRPLGIANVEDRVVQSAVASVLALIYEQDFLDVSYGFRPGRSAKDALETLRKTIDKQPIRVVYEADIKGFFDNLDHGWLRKFLAHRVADRGIHRLIGKILKSGVVLEDGRVIRSPKGAPQGGPLSPLLANLYLHYVLDLWFEKHFRQTCRGEAYMVRYADDFVMCFEHHDDAERFGVELRERLAAFELELEPDKTRLIAFGTKVRRENRGRKTEGTTFDFLGFTHYMRRRSKRKPYRTARKPSAKSQRRFLAETKRWLKEHMHRSPWFHQKVLTAKLRGFFNYFKLRHCTRILLHIRFLVYRIWVRVLRRRSQRGRRLWWWVVKRKPWFQLPPVTRPRVTKMKAVPKRGKRSKPSSPPSDQLDIFKLQPTT